MEWNRWSEEQRAAILRHSGNTLVSASAGSGKTAVVVEHVVRLVTGRMVGMDLPPVPVRRILMLTFNNAVGEELREKINAELLAALTPGNAEYVRDQLYDLPFADIGTLHGYCKKLISEHFDVLGLDPGFTVMDADEAERLRDRCLSETMGEADESVYELSEFLGGKNALRDTAVGLYESACAEYDGLAKLQAEWMSEYVKPIEQTAGVKYYLRLITKGAEDLKERAEILAERMKDLGLVRHAAALKADCRILDTCIQARTFDRASALKLDFARSLNGTKAEKDADTQGLIAQYASLRKEYAALKDYARLFEGGAKAEAEHMNSARELMLTLTNVVLSMAEKFAAEKSRENKLDFNDLEQYACKLLEDKDLARSVAERYDYVCVDEYQDINAVQERILQALTGEKHNLFMVGDAKQSIYAFRHADPSIFLGKYDKYIDKDGGEAINLNRNFRSAPGILNFANKVFSRLMTRLSCDMDYSKDGMFIVEGEDNREVKVAVFKRPEKEVLAFDIRRGYSVKEDASRRRAPQTRREAVYIAERINALVGHKQIRLKDGSMKTIDYGDITLLARTTTGGVPDILETLRDLGIPLDASGLMREDGNIYIDRFVDLMRVIDNFRQDIPLSSALIQFGNFDYSECVKIRRCGGDYLWQSVKACAQGRGALSRRVREFTDMLEGYRTMSAYMSVSDLMRRIISDTDYDAIVQSAEGGGKFLAELNAFVGSVAGKQYDRSLAAFISVVNSGIKTGVATESENCVHTCTVHASKGLEFPVVFLIDSGSRPKPLGEKNVLFDKVFGIASRYADKLTRTKDNTLFYNFMMRLQNINRNAEMIRLLYVALTRARNLLYITGTCSWEFGEVNSSGGFLSLLSTAFAADPELKEMYMEDEVLIEEEGKEEGYAAEVPKFRECDFKGLSEYMDRPYRYIGSSHTGIKYSVSAINKERDTGEYSSGSSQALFGEESAAVGTAYHRVLSEIDFSVTTPEGVRAAIQDMIRAGKLTHAEAELADAEVIARCLNSPLIRLAARSRHDREKRFTLYLPADQVLKDAETDEKILVQGALDLMIFGSEGEDNILVDFKYTNRAADEVKHRYAKQLELYALAMEECAGIKPDKKILYILGRDELVFL